MKDTDVCEAPDVAPRPACGHDGTWHTLPEAGALIGIEGEPYIVDLRGSGQTRASSLWRLLASIKANGRGRP